MSKMEIIPGKLVVKGSRRLLNNLNLNKSPIWGRANGKHVT